MNPPEFSHFTPRAQQTLVLARKEAVRLDQNYIGTEHFLLGLIRLGLGVAASVLAHLGLNLENIRAEVEKRTGAKADEKKDDNLQHTPLPYTPRTKHMLLIAMEEAEAHHHTYIGTEHMFLGLLREKEGLAAEIFQKFNVDVKQVEKEILEVLIPKFDEGQKE